MHGTVMLDSEKIIHIKIREIRLEMGLTQEQFAAKLGVSFPTVNRWENQKAKPSPLAIQKLQKLFSNYKRKDRLKQNNIKEKGELIGVL